jgi:hypothetical protein
LKTSPVELFTNLEKFVLKPKSPTAANDLMDQRVNDRGNEMKIIERIQTKKQRKAQTHNPVQSQKEKTQLLK